MLGTAFAVVILVSSSVTGGSTIKYPAPFSGTTGAVNSTAMISSSFHVHKHCAYNVSVPPSINATTGWVRVASDVAASRTVYYAVSHPCSVSASTTASLLGPAFTSTSTGRHNVSIRWLATWSAGANGTGYVWIALVGNLFDNTTKTWLLAKNQSVLVYTAGNSANQHHHPKSGSARNQSLAVAFSVSLRAGDQYLFFTALKTWCSASHYDRIAAGYTWYHLYGYAWADIGIGWNEARVRAIYLS